MLPPWGSGCDWQEPGATHGPELGRRARSLAQGDGDKQHLRPQDSTMEHRDRKQTEKMGRLSSIHTITHTPKYYTDVEIHFGLSSRLWSWLHVRGKIESKPKSPNSNLDFSFCFWELDSKSLVWTRSMSHMSMTKSLHLLAEVTAVGVRNSSSESLSE